MKKFLAIALAALLVFSLVACGTPATTSTAGADTSTATPAPAAGGGEKVGISMPTKSLQRWNQDGSYMQEKFEEVGYEVDLQYADNDAAQQVSQIENMISGGCKVLVIAAIDSSVLGTVLADAKSKDIPVFAYDRLIMDTDAVSYYATFDNWKVGTLQGNYIADALDLENADGPFNIELFTGDPGDNNINFFFGGAMEVLQPYIDSGKLVVKSGQTDIMQCATVAWDPANAQSRMENLISAQGYSPSGTKLDAVLSSNDSCAQGIATALKGAGYDDTNFPILTGQDCDEASMKNMLSGYQSMSVFKDTRTLAAQVVKMVQQTLNGEEVEVNDTTTYNTNLVDVPSFLCDPVSCDLDNYQELLIDTGYYTEEQIKP